MSETAAPRAARGLDPNGVWPLERSSELFELRYGKALVEASREIGDVPVYGTNGRTGWHNEALFKGPGIVIGRKGMGNLGVEYTDRDYWVIDTAYSLRPRRGMDLKFAYYMVNFVGLNHLKHGTSNPSLTREAFGDQYFPVPPAAEQQAIAEVLGALDDKIASNLALIAAAREYAVLISRVPIAMTRLGNVVLHQSRQVQPAKMAATEVDLFSLPGFDSGTGAERVSPSEIKSGKFLIEGSVVLVSKLNPRIPRIWPIDQDGSVVPKFASTEFLVLEPFASTPDVLWALLSQPEFTSALEGQVAGTSGSHQRVRPADLLSIHIPDPRHISPQLHEDINGVLAPVRVLLRENRTLAATRDALLPQLMSGKLRVRDAERIAEEAGV